MPRPSSARDEILSPYSAPAVTCNPSAALAAQTTRDTRAAPPTEYELLTRPSPSPLGTGEFRIAPRTWWAINTPQDKVFMPKEGELSGRGCQVHSTGQRMTGFLNSTPAIHDASNGLPSDQAELRGLLKASLLRHQRPTEPFSVLYDALSAGHSSVDRLEAETCAYLLQNQRSPSYPSSPASMYDPRDPMLSRHDFEERSDRTSSTIDHPGRINEWINGALWDNAAPSLAPATQPSSPAASRASHVGFRPMAAVSGARRSTGQEVVLADGSKFSGNYRGEHNPRNASAAGLRPEENCALWVTNLPEDCTHNELLGHIRNLGRIWCVVINKPDYVTHATAAAKVVFFTPEPAQAFLAASLTRGIYVRGRRIKVAHNRVKYGASHMTGNESRVLIITGSSKLVNEKSLTDFFKQRFVFEVDEITTLIETSTRACIEYKFGSYRCQAAMGKLSLEMDRPEGLEKVEYGMDPCEVGETMSSYGVAGERIQGHGI